MSKKLEMQEAIDRVDLKHLSPCGLDCQRCADYEHGEIKQISSRLAQLLGNYRPVAKMKTEKEPIYNGYSQLKKF